MKMVLALLARNYELIEVGTEDGTSPQERFSFTMFPLGLRMKIGMRDSALSAAGSGLPGIAARFVNDRIG